LSDANDFEKFIFDEACAMAVESDKKRLENEKKEKEKKEKTRKELERSWGDSDD
jgi:hypothetical protein